MSAVESVTLLERDRNISQLKSVSLFKDGGLATIDQ